MATVMTWRGSMVDYLDQKLIDLGSISSSDSWLGV